MEFKLTFEAASEKVKNLPKKPTDDELLKLYGLYKQSVVGNINTERPGWLDFKGKAKWNNWNFYKGLDQERAKIEYIKFVEFLILKYNCN